MSRVIKFRGIHPEVGVVMDVCVIGWMHDEVYFEQGSDVSYQIDDCKLMQFTGLLDKNGKEIFDGDITPYLECSREGKVNAQVYYCEIKAQFRVKWMDGEHELSDNLGNCNEWFEVIGNIHQNPELIK